MYLQGVIGFFYSRKNYAAITTFFIHKIWQKDQGRLVLFQDAHGDQFGQINRDKSQDYQLIVGYQYQDTTVLRFTRKLETCDGEDLSITVRYLQSI